jgi:hypothetical protein
MPITSTTDTNALGGLLLTQNVNAGTSAHAAVQLSTDTGSAWIFKNSSTRTDDGGAKTCTFCNDDGDLRLAAKGTSPYIYLKASTGNVGIGTTSPGEKLDVSGNINARVAFKGGVKLIGNELKAPGYVELYNPDGTRAAYFGYASFWGSSYESSANAIMLQPEGKFDRIKIGSKEISTRARKFDVFQSTAPTLYGVNGYAWTFLDFSLTGGPYEVREFIDDDCLVCWDASGYSAGGGFGTFTLERYWPYGWTVIDSVSTYFVNAHQKVSRSTSVRLDGKITTVGEVKTMGFRIKFTGQVDMNDRASLSILRL